MFRQAVRGILHANGAGVALASSRGYTSMMDVIAVACEEFGLTVSENKTEPCTYDPTPAQRHMRYELRRQTNCIDRRPSSDTLVVLLAIVRTSIPKISVSSAPLGQVPENIVPNCTIDGMPCRHSRLGYSKWSWWTLCRTDAPRGLCTLKTLGACVTPITSHYCASSAFSARLVPGTNLYCMGRSLRGPVSKASKRHYGSVRLGLSGQLFGKVTKDSRS